MCSGVCGAVCRTVCGAGKDLPENKQPLICDPLTSACSHSPSLRAHSDPEGEGQEWGWGLGGPRCRRWSEADEEGGEQ